MDDRDWLAERFEAHRPRLRALAVHMLGSGAEADDAVQETWLRLSRTDPAGVDNLGGWLTTVVAQVCLDQLRSRRPEEPLDDRVPEPPAEGLGPEDQALVADAVGPALLVVLSSRGGDLQALLSLLDPQVVLRSDPAAVAAGTPAELRGAAEVAGSFAGAPGRPGRPWSTGRPASSGPRAAGRGWPSPSPSPTAGSPRSGCWPAPSGCAGSSWWARTRPARPGRTRPRG